MFRRILISSMLLIVPAIVAATFFPTADASGAKKDPPSSIIRVAPTAPVFDDAKRLAELADRRKRVAEAIGPKAMLVLFSAEPRVYANDVDYAFRQENSLFYLTNLNQKRATLVLMPANKVTPEILFLPRRNAAAETWTGHMYSPQEAAQLSGMKEIWEASEFDGFVKAIEKHEPFRPKPENVFMSDPGSSPTVREGSVVAGAGTTRF